MAFFSDNDVHNLIRDGAVLQLGQIRMSDIDVEALWFPLDQLVLLRRLDSENYVGFADGNVLETLGEFFDYSNDAVLEVSNLRVFERNEDGVDTEVDIGMTLHDSRWSDFVYHNQVFDCSVRLVTNDEAEAEATGVQDEAVEVPQSED